MRRGLPLSSGRKYLALIYSILGSANILLSLEANLGIIVASLPTLRSIFDLFINTIASRIRSHYTRRLKSAGVKQPDASALSRGGDRKPSGDDGVSQKNLIPLDDESFSQGNTWRIFHRSDAEANHSRDNVGPWARMDSLDGVSHHDQV